MNNKFTTSDFIIGQNTDGLFVKEYQDVPDSLLTNNRQLRHESVASRDDFHQFASIPVVIVDKWLREGFDVMSNRNITAKQIIAKLNAEGLDAFITTNKRL